MRVNSLVSGIPSYSKLSYESMLSLLEFIKMSVVFSPFMAATVSPLPQIKLFMSSILPRGGGGRGGVEGVVGGRGACPSLHCLLCDFVTLTCSNKVKIL